MSKNCKLREVPELDLVLQKRVDQALETAFREDRVTKVVVSMATSVCDLDEKEVAEAIRDQVKRRIILDQRIRLRRSFKQHKLRLPPAHLMVSIAKFMLRKQDFDGALEPMVADHRHEIFELIEEENVAQARYRSFVLNLSIASLIAQCSLGWLMKLVKALHSLAK